MAPYLRGKPRAGRMRTGAGIENNPREFHGCGLRFRLARRHRLPPDVCRAWPRSWRKRRRTSGGPSAAIVLVPHRAVYDLASAERASNSQVVGVRGRILYDFDGNACEGYTLQFRQVSELDTGEGKNSTSDLRSTTWEDGDAKSFKFTSQNFLNQKLVDSVDGHAEHGTTRPPSIWSSRSRRCSTSTPRWCFRPSTWCG